MGVPRPPPLTDEDRTYLPMSAPQPFTPRSSTIPDDYQSDAGAVDDDDASSSAVRGGTGTLTPLDSPTSGPRYDDLPPSYEHSQAQALDQVLEGAPPSDDLEIPVHRMTLGDHDQGQQHPSAFNLPEALLTEALAFANEAPPPKSNRPPRLSRRIALPCVSDPADPAGQQTRILLEGLRTSLSRTTTASSLKSADSDPAGTMPGAFPTGDRCSRSRKAQKKEAKNASPSAVSFARAHGAILDSHDVTPAAFAAFLDGLNVLCALANSTLDSLLHPPVSPDQEHPMSSLVSAYLAHANTSYFAPRGLHVRLSGTRALLAQLEAAKPQRAMKDLAMNRDAEARVDGLAAAARRSEQVERVRVRGLPAPADGARRLAGLAAEIASAMSSEATGEMTAGTTGEMTTGTTGAPFPTAAVRNGALSGDAPPYEPGTGGHSQFPGDHKQPMPPQPSQPPQTPQPPQAARQHPPPGQTWADWGASWETWGEDLGRRLERWGEDLGRRAEEWGQNVERQWGHGPPWPPGGAPGPSSRCGAGFRPSRPGCGSWGATPAAGSNGFADEKKQPAAPSGAGPWAVTSPWAARGPVTFPAPWRGHPHPMRAGHPWFAGPARSAGRRRGGDDDDSDSSSVSSSSSSDDESDDDEDFGEDSDSDEDEEAGDARLGKGKGKGKAKGRATPAERYALRLSRIEARHAVALARGKRARAELERRREVKIRRAEKGWRRMEKKAEKRERKREKRVAKKGRKTEKRKGKRGAWLGGEDVGEGVWVVVEGLGG